MGDVYRAHDTRLLREVAVKVLPADVSSDPERLRRFEANARAASARSGQNGGGDQNRTDGALLLGVLGH